MAGKKRKSSEGDRKPRKDRHRQALDDDNDSVVSKTRSRAPKQHHEEDKAFIDGSDRHCFAFAKILNEALKQQREVLEEDEKAEEAKLNTLPPLSIESVQPSISSDDEDEIDDFHGFAETQSQYDGDAQEINEEDERILAAFMPKDAGPQQTLADVIIRKIREKDAEVAMDERPVPKLDTSIIDLYKGVGKVLSRYTNGKIPKAFKHIASFEFWEEVLYLTEPEKWTPNAMYQATRLFASRNVKKAQRFYALVLLPRVRNDIRENKRLHFALYQSLKKSLYKPAAFFKGILLPLCKSGTCTLREAVIIGSIIQKLKIPPIHSSVALMKLAEMDYCGTTSYFIKLFLDKKYAMPYRVLDAVVAHFMKFLEDERIMPVIWHQSLLSLVQRYKNELTGEDKDNIDRLLQHQKHHLVTPEIRRELRDSLNRGEKEEDMDILLLPNPTFPVALFVINRKIEEDRWDLPAVPMEED
ncbi:unnamed protein product [Spirodela intermedia]|uniref:Uncharacterized protein n=1 Tax=Spirodela intermedia TaxID=51605 RepID=A0A7I8IRS6_SPIIN|nr:unnamed protein product [Spirodela intermedia]CAA6660444.1 unnamed protein product [Spirodela intermedia]